MNNPRYQQFKPEEPLRIDYSLVQHLIQAWKNLFNIRQLSDNFILILITQAQQSSQFLFTAEKPWFLPDLSPATNVDNFSEMYLNVWIGWYCSIFSKLWWDC